MFDISDEQKSIFSSIIYQIDIHFLEKEKEMAIGLITGFIYSKKTMTPREYFNERYNQNKEELKKVCENKVDGVCPLHNLFCKYPDCEE